MLARIVNWLIVSLGGWTHQAVQTHTKNAITDAYNTGYEEGEAYGRKKAVTRFAVLPLPFTEDQLRGAQQGEFITPGGNFSVVFGECNIPAPSQHGYEQIARYVNKQDLSPLLGDIVCHHGEKFGAYPWDSENLVPVIITVLR